MEITKDEIDRTLKPFFKMLPPQNGYTYILPSPNNGKQLLITGLFDPCKASKIAEKILKGESKVEDYDFVEEIDLLYKET